MQSFLNVTSFCDCFGITKHIMKSKYFLIHKYMHKIVLELLE